MITSIGREENGRRLVLLDELGTLEAALGPAQVSAELDVLAVLANETRYTLARVLVAAEEELCVCALLAVVDVSESG